MHGNGWESCLVFLLMNVLGGRFLQLGNWHALIATQEKKKPVINCTRNSGRLDASLLFYHKHAWLFTIKPATRSSSLTHQKISRFEGLFTWHRRSTLKAKTNSMFGWSVLGLSRLIFSHIILFILPAEHYSSDQPNSLKVLKWGGFGFSITLKECSSLDVVVVSWKLYLILR